MLYPQAKFPMVCNAISILFAFTSLAQVWKEAKMVKFLESNNSTSIITLQGLSRLEIIRLKYHHAIHI
jgi:hypothetical protein